MTTNNLKAVVYGRLEAIAAAEKITRAELAALSRELLIYVPETHDIAIVNRLIGVLTPMNKKVSIMYFTHFLPWEVERDSDGNFVSFGKMMKKEKQVKRRMDAITEWLADEDNTMWTWAETNVDLTKKKDFRAMIAKAIEKALQGDEKSGTEALTMAQVVETFFEAGVEVDDLLAGIDQHQEATADEQPPLAEAA